MDLCDLKNDDNLYCVNENEVPTLKEQLLDKLKRYGFEGFVHTTELENFRKIIECGYLHPRKTLVEGEMRFTDRAEAEVLRKTDDYIQRCSRFYYYYKTPTNYMAKYKNPVALVFDEELIFLKKGVFFSPENACYNHWTNNVAKALDFDWEGVFERSRHALSKYYKQLPYEECAKKINKIRNAEFLVKGSVSVKYIKKILVKDSKTKEAMKVFCDQENFDKIQISPKEFEYD